MSTFNGKLLPIVLGGIGRYLANITGKVSASTSEVLVSSQV